MDHQVEQVLPYMQNLKRYKIFRLLTGQLGPEYPICSERCVWHKIKASSFQLISPSS